MQTARRQAEFSPASEEASALDKPRPELERPVSASRPSPRALKVEAPQRQGSSSKTVKKTKPATPDGSDRPWTIDELRAVLIARAEEEKKRGFRLTRLTWVAELAGKLLRLLLASCIAVVAAGIVVVVLVVYLPKPNKAEVQNKAEVNAPSTSKPATKTVEPATAASESELNKAEVIAPTASKPAIEAPETPIQRPTPTGASERSNAEVIAPTASKPAIEPPEAPIQRSTATGASEPKKAEVIGAVTKPIMQAPEAAIKPPVMAPASEPVEPIHSDTSAAAAQPLSTEEVTHLISRADTLVAMADLVSARAFYERAVRAGDAQAALKLGATYDPSFLSQTGLRFVRADPAAATHWYQRARELGAGEQAEILLKRIQRN